MPPRGGHGRVGTGTLAQEPAPTWVFLARLPVPSGSCLVPRTTWCTSGTCRPRRSSRNYRATQVSAGICAGRTPALHGDAVRECVVLPPASRVLPRPSGGLGAPRFGVVGRWLCSSSRLAKAGSGFNFSPWPSFWLPDLTVHVGSVCGRRSCVCVLRRDKRGAGDIHSGLEALVAL